MKITYPDFLRRSERRMREAIAKGFYINMNYWLLDSERNMVSNMEYACFCCLGGANLVAEGYRPIDTYDASLEYFREGNLFESVVRFNKGEESIKLPPDPDLLKTLPSKRFNGILTPEQVRELSAHLLACADIIDAWGLSE